MRYDFYAEKYEHPNIHEWSQYTILKCTRIGDRKQYIKSIRNYYKRNQIDRYWSYTKWFIPNESDIPNNSILIKIEFKLKKPFISSDDEQFWPNPGNPLCKDKILRIPYIRPSSWKGSLRSIMRDRLKKPVVVVERLLGSERAKEELKRGRLTFYPTFLDNIDIDVIAPHDRATKAGKRRISPIFLEIAPENAKGTFSLLYFPFDLLGRAEEEVKEEIEQDLEVLKESIPAMLTKYGFGAKTTAGYGVVKKDIEFQILPGMNEKAKDGHFGEEESVFAREMDELIEKYGEKHEQRKN